MPATAVPMHRIPLIRPLLFLDFEASGLTSGSWPIEIGYAWITGSMVEVTDLLISPRPDWSLADWSETAARVHGIPLAALAHAPDAEYVAAETDRFAAFDVVSDNPNWDGLWLDRLRGPGRPRIPVLGLRGEIRRRLSPRAADDFTQRRLNTPAAHRAGPDAARLAEAWVAAADYGLAA